MTKEKTFIGEYIKNAISIMKSEGITDFSEHNITKWCFENRKTKNLPVSKYDDMFRRKSGNYHDFEYQYVYNNPAYHKYRYYNVISNLVYGHKYICFLCKRQTRSESCCGEKTLKKNPNVEIPKKNDKKAWKRLQENISKDEIWSFWC